MSDYQLGQRVKVSGTVRKGRSGNMVSYSDGPQPQRINYPKPKIFTEGVIVGSLTIQDGEAWHDSDYGRQFTPTNGTARRAWLVAFDLRMKPTMCFEHQVSPIEPAQ